MSFFGALSGIGSVLGGLGGLVGKSKTMDPRASIHSAAQGAREAGEKYGFNPLTLLQSGAGGFGGGGGGGTPPLASIQMITDGLTGLDDVVSGDAARRRAADQLNLDLAQLKLDQARSGVVAVTPIYAREGVGQGPSPLGGRSTEVYTSHGGTSGGGYGRSGAVPPVGDLELPSGVHLKPDPYLDRGAGLFVGGTYLEAPPGWTPGGQVEEEVGEDNWAVTVPYGFALANAYLTHNTRRAADALFPMTEADMLRDIGRDVEQQQVGKPPAHVPFGMWSPRVRGSGSSSPSARPRGTRRFDPNHRDGYFWAF